MPDTDAARVICKGEIRMAENPDVYLLYEYSKKNAFTVRYKVTLSEPVNEKLLTQAAGEAMTRFPYYSVKVGLDEGENYVLLPNDSPILNPKLNMPRNTVFTGATPGTPIWSVMWEKQTGAAWRNTSEVLSQLRTET